MWENAQGWRRSPDHIRAALTEGSIAASDRLARFVGLDAYLAAGGTVTRDLFAEDGGEYLDRLLVMQLADAKLAEAAEAVRAEGWKWVKAEAVRDYSVSYGRLPSGKASAKNRARAGVVIHIGHDGQMEVAKGLIDPEPLPSGMSAALVMDLTAHRTAALRLELTRRPDVALAVTVHALAARLLYDGGADTCLDLAGRSADLGGLVRVAEDSPAHRAMQDEGERWGEVLPGDPADLLAWCRAQPQETLLDLLAYLAALTVDAVQGPPRPLRPCRQSRRRLVSRHGAALDAFARRLLRAAAEGGAGRDGDGDQGSARR